MKTGCVFSLDDAYLMPFKVFFTSLELTSSIPVESPIFILHTSTLSHSSVEDIRLFLQGYDRHPVFLDISTVAPSRLPIREGSQLSPAVYYRLFLEDVLPNDITQIVYLDSDMLALRSIRDLFYLEVESLIASVDHCKPHHGLRLWGNVGGPYFQAGVLIIPVHKWRSLGLSTVFSDIIEREETRLVLYDQDVLNIALRNEWQRLPIWYNIEEALVAILPIHEILDNAFIIHFSGSSKPWKAFKPSPFTDLWDDAYEKTFGIPFDRTVYMPPRSVRYKAAVRSRLSKFFGGLGLL